MDYKKCDFNLPVTSTFDVAVVGGGPAGVTAALSAARNGARTLLVERTSYLGGMLTGGLVHSLHGYRLHKNYINGLPMTNWSTPLLIKGISLEIVKRLQKENGTINHDHYGDPSVRENYDEEIMIHVLDEMTKEAGVTVLFNTFAFAVVKEEDTVQGIIVVNKSGPQIIESSVVIDASGDADLAANAGVEYEFGSKDEHLTHGVSMLMEIGGIDADRFIAYLKERPVPSEESLDAINRDFERLVNGGSSSPDTILSLDGTCGKFNMSGKKQTWEEIEHAYQEGKYLMLPGVEMEWLEYLKDNPDTPYMINTKTPVPCYPRAPKFSWFGLVRDGKLRYDQTISGVHEVFADQTNEEEISKAIVLMRDIDWIYMKFLKERIPGFEEAYIIKTSPLVGTRESRRIIGEYMLTARDCETGVKFDDSIALCGRACNIHHMSGQSGLWYWIEPENAFSIPYRCLIPKKVDNLLVAGRCASVDFIASGATRSMPPCMAMGEAAGTAAALAVQGNILPRNLDIDVLQRSLRAQGVLLPELRKTKIFSKGE